MQVNLLLDAREAGDAMIGVITLTCPNCQCAFQLRPASLQVERETMACPNCLTQVPSNLIDYFARVARAVRMDSPTQEQVRKYQVKAEVAELFAGHNH